jgi:toxin ParE1/3/4
MALNALSVISLEDHCRSLSVFPDRGVRRDDLRPGLRILGFERRAAIALHVADDTVTILRILCGGREVESVSPEAMEFSENGPFGGVLISFGKTALLAPTAARVGMAFSRNGRDRIAR